MIKRVVQVNLQAHFGGGEVYTRFLCEAVEALGLESELYVSVQAGFWASLSMGRTRVIVVDGLDSIPTKWPDGTLVLSHAPLPEAQKTSWRASARLAVMVHMPTQGRNPRVFDGYDLVLPVSEYVRQGLLAAGVEGVSSLPLYAVADVDRGAAGGDTTKPIYRTSRYDWDRRKGRDVLLGMIEPIFERFRPHPAFQRRPGLTLGIVSRITPIKQFPVLFQTLTPVLARYPQVSLEIFGSGGYASIRDLDRALRPIAKQVRYWGLQRDVRSVYHQIDFLMTGLPEKEALGLNVLEAQACGTPVLAVDAPPFTETVQEGIGGWRYTDPREDGGQHFETVLQRCLQGENVLNPQASSLLPRFTPTAFCERLGAVLNGFAESQGRSPLST